MREQPMTFGNFMARVFANALGFGVVLIATACIFGADYLTAPVDNYIGEGPPLVVGSDHWWDIVGEHLPRGEVQTIEETDTEGLYSVWKQDAEYWVRLDVWGNVETGINPVMEEVPWSIDQAPLRLT